VSYCRVCTEYVERIEPWELDEIRADERARILDLLVKELFLTPVGREFSLIDEAARAVSRTNRPGILRAIEVIDGKV
jgi:hypothetical protein